ncbi:hypothetical protein KEM52_002627 [Ascosphaera acerosa]|nr:hypothetical protein KEM52_002627 [Ascosphaera acerosa]
MGQVTPEPQSGAAPPEYTSDAESGYCSSMSDSMTSTATTTTTASEAPAIHFTESHLQHLNKQLQSLEPQGERGAGINLTPHDEN